MAPQQNGPDNIKIEGDQNWVINQLTKDLTTNKGGQLTRPDVLKLLKQGLLRKLNPQALKKTSPPPTSKPNKSM